MNLFLAACILGIAETTSLKKLHHVPEFQESQYTTLFVLDIKTKESLFDKSANYKRDNSKMIESFDRVAYYMELGKKSKEESEFVWVSFNPPTMNAEFLGVPTHDSGAVFQTQVENMTVFSNKAGLLNGVGLDGLLEFWPSSYTPKTTETSSAANDFEYDSSDTYIDKDGYGSMQVHFANSGDTIFAYNRWGLPRSQAKHPVDLGIGNSILAGASDWTGAKNANEYKHKKLYVFVRNAQYYPKSSKVSKSSKNDESRTPEEIATTSTVDVTSKSTKKSKKTSKSGKKSGRLR
eukprot:m.174803 g.174803  ORF g.174803 m.174803 type:complete len:292 (+) comp15411_c0_seq5:199-1074(+)